MATAEAVLQEMRTHLRVAASDQRTVERAIETAARNLDIPFARAWAIWYGKARQILAHETDNIRARAVELRRQQIERVRADLARLEREHAALTRQLAHETTPGLGVAADATRPAAAQDDRPPQVERRARRRAGS